MKTIKFIREDFRNGKLIKYEVIRTWSHFTPSMIPAICWNFYEGFCTAFSKDFRRPCNPGRDGFEIWSYNFHRDQSGFVFRLVDGRNMTIKLK